MHDSEIIERFFARDESALDALQQKYGGSLRRMAQNILGDDGDSSTFLPEWFDLVTDADRIVPSDCALTADEYPGAATIRLEDRLGRGVPHQLQPHDRGVAELIAELLG